MLRLAEDTPPPEDASPAPEDVTFTDSAAVCRVFVVDDFLHQLVVAELPHGRHHLWTLNTTHSDAVLARSVP